ncbi:sulfatase-like hydrolase/transferase [Cellulophaga sp. F20128]|uniref:sulfatase-like hydrolase/transferase n=1 Tax=Cellulophaga sp. F20128 TaxID=2926413 RepID=UPI001FF36C48|nr:sulfatase-like hydrolase/transferase [Cellulophaga sp. F20128]MCK0156296.1 sulfatase-like hydrolase/transferase [Cellulophaga sp. F20128]
MKMYIKAIAVLVIVLTFMSCKEGATSTKNADTTNGKKPNIIFLFADDQSYKAVNALGNPEISTPTMDSFTTEGTTFTHAYNMGGWNGAICLASRAMIISGRSVWRAQQISDEYKKNRQTDKTWSKLMESAGYETYMSGKWHISAKADSIFNHVTHVLPGMPNQVPEGYSRPKSETDTLWQPWKTEFGGYWKGGKHWSEMIREDAVAFLDSAKNREKPFFMYVAFNAPHDPRQAPKKYVDMYPLDKIALPESHLPEYPYAEEMGAGRKLRDEALAPFPRTEYAVKVNRQEYYAITTHLDDQLKQIITRLKENNQLDNTYIFYTADHGLSVGEHGLMGKQNMFDHSMRVPLMVIGPDIPKGKKVETDVYLQDVMASALEIAGIEKPDYVEFHSLLDFAKGNKTKSNYNGIYGTYQKNSQRMIRKDGYKLIVYPKIEKVLLYDLNKDPKELKDIAEQPENSKKLKTLFADLMELQKEMGDELDLKSLFDKLI